MPLLILKRLKRSLTENAARAVPISWWNSFLETSWVFPLYHVVSDESPAHTRHLYRCRTVSEFEQDLEFFLRHFEPADLSAVVDSLDRPSHPGKRRFHLTFDDGFREVHDIIAPLLLKKGIPASFYLATSFLDGAAMGHRNKVSLLIERITAGISPQTLGEVERELGLLGGQTDWLARMRAITYSDRARVDRIAAILEFDFAEYIKTARPHLTSEQVLRLAGQGFAIGAHSCDHPYYADLSLDEQLAQTRTSMDLVATRFGAKIRAFAFPFSDESVTPQFFAQAMGKDRLAVTFGTNGVIPHFCPRNIQRISMERAQRTARPIIISEYVRAARHRFDSR